MNLTQIVKENKSTNIENKNSYIVGKNDEYNAKADNYSLFCEQYLEKPIVSGDKKMAISPTACTIKGIPVIDDF